MDVCIFRYVCICKCMHNRCDILTSVACIVDFFEKLINSLVDNANVKRPKPYCRSDWTNQRGSKACDCDGPWECGERSIVKMIVSKKELSSKQTISIATQVSPGLKLSERF